MNPLNFAPAKFDRDMPVEFGSKTRYQQTGLLQQGQHACFLFFFGDGALYVRKHYFDRLRWHNHPLQADTRNCEVVCLLTLGALLLGD